MRLHQVWEILAQAVDIPARTGSISSPSTYANPLKNGRGEKTRLGGNGDRGAAGDAKRTPHPRRLGMQDLNEQSTVAEVLDGIALSHKRILIQGVSAGFGIDRDPVLSAPAAFVTVEPPTP